MEQNEHAIAYNALESVICFTFFYQTLDLAEFVNGRKMDRNHPF